MAVGLLLSSLFNMVKGGVMYVTKLDVFQAKTSLVVDVGAWKQHQKLIWRSRQKIQFKYHLVNTAIYKLQYTYKLTSIEKTVTF